MTLGMTLVTIGGICIAALALNSVDNFFLRRSLVRNLARLRDSESLALDPAHAIRKLYRMRNIAQHSQMMPSWRGPEIVQLGQILSEECSRRIYALTR